MKPLLVAYFYISSFISLWTVANNCKVAQIIPYPANDTLVRHLNSLIPNWAETMNLTQSPIFVVDQYTGFDGKTDLYDGLHPSESGDVNISDKFYPAIRLAVGSVVRDHYD